MMKQINRLLMTLLALAMVVTFGATKATAAGCASGAGGEGGIVVDKNAPGTKYEGPLTIHYVQATNEDGSFIWGVYDTSFFLRLRKGSTLYSFSGTSQTSGAVEGIQGTLETFFNERVMPLLYPGLEEDDLPLWALKSIDQLVDDALIEGDCCDLLFNIMDIVLAVQD